MLRLFLPQICIHCGTHCDPHDAKKNPLGKYLCAVCLRQLELFEPPVQDELLPKFSLLHELPLKIKISAAFSFQPDGIIQSLIHHFKYQEMPRLATTLGKICVGNNASLYDEYDYIIPVPLHRTRYSERGYNQSEMLAKGISNVSTIPTAKRGLLKRVRQTPSQTGLTLEEREENVRGAFALSKKGIEKFQKKKILVVDDVMTTGATLASAANSLISAKPKCIDIFAMAAVIEM